MQILEYPHDSLRQKTKAVDKITPELVEIAKEMYSTMKAAGGIGLAANQVGLDISLIVLEDNGKPLILFNPTILKRSPRSEYSSEACLSFPNVIRMIKRTTEVTVKYRDETGRMQYLVLRGLQARCIEHEYDHLQGKTFLDLEQRKEQNDQTNEA